MHRLFSPSPWLRSQQPAFGLYLLGLGSAIRGLTLDQVTSVGGAWGWKSTETLSFVLGDTRPARWGLFGGACVLSAMVGIWVVRRSLTARLLSTVLLGGDLMLCALLGDGVNANLHGLGLLMLWFGRPIQRLAPSEPPTPTEPSASAPSEPSA